MIVVKVENWPGGSPTRVREIARVFVRKDTGGKYTAQLEEQGNDFLEIPGSSKTVEIEGHEINTSVFKLLAKVFGEAIKQK